MQPLTVSAMAFVSLALGMLTFDGLHVTFWRLALIGQNPPEFTGCSAVQGVNALGLVAVWAITALGLFAMFRAGAWLAGGPRALPAGVVMLSFLAIAAGYHGAHHLVTLLTSGQFMLAALNDPLFQGDSLLGLSPFFVSIGFLTDQSAMTAIWNIQFAAILGAHVLAVVLAVQLAGPGVWMVAHLPLTVLMVGYTVLGLWLLAAPAGA